MSESNDALDIAQMRMKGGPLLVVLSGPSGVGKDAVIQRMRELDFPLHYVVTATTREKRFDEAEGVDYFFLTSEQFEVTKNSGGFIESAEVYGHWYGVPRSEVDGILAQGKDVIVKVDVQGAASIKRIVEHGIFIFLLPPSLDDLEDRLRHRKTESKWTMDVRVRTAKQEFDSIGLFDYIVVNDNGCLDVTVETVQAIIKAEKCRLIPEPIR